MKRLVLCSAMLAMLFSGAWQANAVPIFNPATGNLYELLPASTWTIAETAAQALGGNLVTISSPAENAFLVANFFPGTHWIGFNDQATEGTFVWSSGEAVVFTNWNAGEPNDVGGEDFGSIITGLFDGVWNDLPGGTTITGIAEFPVPEPSTLVLFTLGFVGVVGFGYRQRRRAR